MAVRVKRAVADLRGTGTTLYEAGVELPAMEVAGPRERIFFDPTDSLRHCHLWGTLSGWDDSPSWKGW